MSAIYIATVVGVLALTAWAAWTARRRFKSQVVDAQRSHWRQLARDTCLAFAESDGGFSLEGRRSGRPVRVAFDVAWSRRYRDLLGVRADAPDQSRGRLCVWPDPDDETPATLWTDLARRPADDPAFADRFGIWACGEVDAMLPRLDAAARTALCALEGAGIVADAEAVTVVFADLTADAIEAALGLALGLVGDDGGPNEHDIQSAPIST